jgi:heat shock protein HtpX
MSAAGSTLRAIAVFGTVFALMYAIALALSLFLPVWGLAYVLLWTGLAFVMNLGMYFGAHRIVLWSYGARVVDRTQAPQLYGLVEQVAQAASIPVPRVAIMNDPSPNAFATGRNPRHAVVCFTTGILNQLNERELKGVVAHELSHVKNHDTLVMTAVATVAAFFAYIIQFGGAAASSRDNRGGGLVAMILFAILGTLAALLIKAFVSRRREYRADATAARLLGDASGLSNALLKIDYAARGRPMRVAHEASAHLFIVNPLTRRGIAGLFSTHPPIPDRVDRLQQMRL